MQAQEETTLAVSYCEDNSTGAIGASETELNMAAVEFTPEFLSKYVGCKIIAVQYQLGSSFGLEGSVFLTNDINEATTQPYAMEYSIPDFDNVPCYKWLTLDLPQAVTIDAGKTYFAGIRLTPPSFYGKWQFAVNESEEGYNHSYMYDPAADKWKKVSAFSMAEYAAMQEIYEKPHFLIKLVVAGETLPSNDVAVTSIKSVDYLRTSETCSCTYTFKNMAANDVKNVESVLLIDGQEVQRNAFQLSKPIATGEEYESNFENIKFAGEGTHTIAVLVEKVNGEADPNPADNQAEKKVSAIDRYFKHNLFVEAFTTMECANCPQAHDRENEAFNGLEDVVRVDHHSGFYTDILTHDVDVAMLWFYNNNGTTYAPGIMYDRAMIDYFYDPQRGYGEEHTPVIGPGLVDDLKFIHNYMTSEPSYVNVQIHPEFDSATRELKITVSGEQIAHLAGNDVRLNVWLTESGFKASENRALGQMTGSGQKDYTFVHDHALRATLTGNWGEAYKNEVGTYSRTFTTKLNEYWKENNMEVVAFVGNYDSQNPDNCRVFNSAKAPVVGSIEGIALQPTATTASAFAPVYDLQGNRVMQSRASKGIYISGGKKIIR